MTFAAGVVVENDSQPMDFLPIPLPGLQLPPFYTSDFVGQEGTGTLVVSSGATVTTNPLAIGNGSGGSGTVLVTGPASKLTVKSGIVVGTTEDAGGLGTLTVEDGANVSTSGSYGDISVSGKGRKSNVVVEGSDVHQSALAVDDFSLEGFASAQVLDGGAATVGGSANMGLTDDQSVTALSVAGSGSSLNVADALSIGADGTATVSITDNGAVNVGIMPVVGFPPGNLVVSGGVKAVSTVTINGGRMVVKGSGLIGSGDGSVSTVNVDSGSVFQTVLPSTVAGGTLADATITVAGNSGWLVGVPTAPANLTLSGTNNRLDGAAAMGAHLFVEDQSDVTASLINVSAAAVLGGTGTCVANVVSNGLVEPGGSASGPAVGTLRVAGNYLSNATSDLQIELGAATSSMLRVSGIACLGGTLKVDLNGTQPQLNQQFTVLEATGGLSDTFDATPRGQKLPNGLQWDVVYTGNSVILEAVKATGTAVSATAGTSTTFQVATLVGLDPSEDPYLTAEVSYGDGGGAPIDNTNGTSQYGYIDFDGSTATVYGIYGYAKPGIYAVRTTFEINGQEIAIADSKATVSDRSGSDRNYALCYAKCIVPV